MSDDKSKTGSQDRRSVAAVEGYEVDDFAQKHGNQQPGRPGPDC